MGEDVLLTYEVVDGDLIQGFACCCHRVFLSCAKGGCEDDAERRKSFAECEASM